MLMLLLLGKLNGSVDSQVFAAKVVPTGSAAHTSHSLTVFEVVNGVRLLKLGV